MNTDSLYELPFTYLPHPSYKQPVPAYEQIKDSVTVVRGRFGGRNFCGLGAHQGKTIQSRSQESVKREIKRRSNLPGWKRICPYIGGPTANMHGLRCKRPETDARCTRRSCLVPSVCGFLETNQSRFANLVRNVSGMEEVKHVYVNSGIRMDLALLYPDIISLVAKQATGGQLSVAPEHLSKKVLAAMNKPHETGWEQFEAIFQRESAKAGKEQYLVPYFIAGHPGSTIDDAKELGQYLRQRNIRVRQVQEYIPIPMTVSGAMYYTGKDPFTGKDVEVSYKLGEMRKQKDLIMWWKKCTGVKIDPTILSERNHIVSTCHNGEFWKPCPGTTKGYFCCGYQIITPLTGCGMYCRYCVLQAYLENPVQVVYENIADLENEIKRKTGKWKGVVRFGTGEFGDSLFLEDKLHLSERIAAILRALPQMPSSSSRQKARTSAVWQKSRTRAKSLSGFP